MYPASFQYHVPQSIPAALELLTMYGDEARLLAGGHTLVPMMKLRLAQPTHLIDLRKVTDLSGIRENTDALIIGAMTTHYEIESSKLVHSRIPLLSEVASLIADPQVRNRGTIGGSVSHSDPAADFPASLLALEAEAICVSQRGERTVKFHDWCTGLMTTALGDGEILLRLRIPMPGDRAGAVYLKHPHPASHFAVVGIAAVVVLSKVGVCSKARIGVTGVGMRATRALHIEKLVEGQKITPDLLDKVAKVAPDGIDVQGDIHSSTQHRANLCRVYMRRALAAASARASV